MLINQQGTSTTALTIEDCQQHAAECRDMARKEANLSARKKLEDLAVSWDQLCQGRKIAERRQH